jgi:hypothetical protein
MLVFREYWSIKCNNCNTEEQANKATTERWITFHYKYAPTQCWGVYFIYRAFSFQKRKIIMMISMIVLVLVGAIVAIALYDHFRK